jgi:coenzyme F420-reducing hydrogenase beta subunit
VELSCVIQEIHKRDGRFAITGVPCFIKAIRNICLQDKVFAHKIAFTIGIVCGHLKSSFYGEMIAWQLGVTPNELGQVDFRVKIPGAKANEKGVSAASIEEKERQFGPKKVQEMFGTNYGYGYFKYNACDYCDDVLAEAADISIGDAWLPEFMNQGTSILVIRNKAVLEIIEGGVANRDVLLEEMTADRVAESQDAGLRHRREGLAYRLYLKLKQGVPFPVKRVAPMKSSLSPRYRCIHRLRLLLAQSSFEYFQIAKDSGSWGDFQKPMEKLNRRYESVFRLKRMRDLPGKALRFLQRKLANRWK